MSARDDAERELRAAQEAERRAAEARAKADLERIKRLADIEAKMRQRKS